MASSGQCRRFHECQHLLVTCPDNIRNMIFSLIEAFSRIPNLLFVDALSHTHDQMQASWAALIDTITMFHKLRFILVVRDQYTGFVPTNVTVVNLGVDSGEINDIVCIVLAHVLSGKIVTRDNYQRYHANDLFQRAWRCEFGGLANNCQYFHTQVQMKSVMDSASFSDDTFIKRAFECGNNDESWAQLFDHTVPESIRDPIRQLAKTIRPLEIPSIINV